MTELITPSRVTQDYFEWLCEKVSIGKHHGMSYYILAKELNSTEFIPYFGNDDNRAMDGLRLREEYAFDEGLDILPKEPDPCSVFEMIVAMAMRMDFIIGDNTDYDHGKSTAGYFWELIGNLGLEGYDDESFLDMNDFWDVHHSLDIFIKREYMKNGKGGLFPILNKRVNQKKLEIWYQMQNYIKEKYYI